MRLEDCGIYETIVTQNIWFTVVPGARHIYGKQRQGYDPIRQNWKDFLEEEDMGGTLKGMQSL